MRILNTDKTLQTNEGSPINGWDMISSIHLKLTTLSINDIFLEAKAKRYISTNFCL
jgi:hypothetical protein